jgi:chromosome segregation protein
LRSAGAGRGIFVTPPNLESGSQGFVPLGRPLFEQVRPREGFEDFARALLAGVNLVDDLREVVEVYGTGRIPATFVTRAGDVLTPDGVVTGGVRSEGESSGGLLARVREVRDLEGEVAELDLRVETLEAGHSAAEGTLAAAADELENLRNRHHTSALAVANHEKDLERTRERSKALGEAQETRVVERSGILAGIGSMTEESERLRAVLEESRRIRSERQRDLDAFGLKIGSLRREGARLETAATERRVEYAGRAEKCDRLRRACEQLAAAERETREWISIREQEIQTAEARREELATAIEETERKLQVALEHEERARASNDEKRDAFEGVSAAVGEAEEGAREVRGRINLSREAHSKAELKVGEVDLRLAHLDESIREKWEVELATWKPPTPEFRPLEEGGPSVADEDVEATGPEASVESEGGEEPAPNALREARMNAQLAQLPMAERRQRLEETRKKLQALGDVNLGAIEEHEELAERLRFLSEQKADLESTIQSLREAIARINRTSRRRFKETFEAVSKRFSENFPRLFGGGKASLMLTEAEDILDAGVDIVAMPPGKRLQNVNLLSGGEKTMTALALLMSVFQVRPSPFFLLDEVDAALDDANVGRFNQLISELAASSQFLVITHNKRTIEVADVLYGVTMEQKGVSKVVGVELH